MSHRQRLIIDAHRKSSTDIQATHIQKSRMALLTKIRKFTEAQHTFMPGLRSYLDRDAKKGAADVALEPEHTVIYLPSSIPATHREDICLASLADVERRLRSAQAAEALTGLRRQLRAKMMVAKLVHNNASSQKAQTRSKTLRDQVEIRVRTCQRQYNDARSALLALLGPGDWEITLPVLKPEDVHGISERAMTEEEKAEQLAACRMAGLPGNQMTDGQQALPVVAIDPKLSVGEGRRKLSWIWYTVGEAELSGGSGQVEASELLSRDCICRLRISRPAIRMVETARTRATVA